MHAHKRQQPQREQADRVLLRQADNVLCAFIRIGTAAPAPAPAPAQRTTSMRTTTGWMGAGHIGRSTCRPPAPPLDLARAAPTFFASPCRTVMWRRPLVDGPGATSRASASAPPPLPPLGRPCSGSEWQCWNGEVCTYQLLCVQAAAGHGMMIMGVFASACRHLAAFGTPVHKQSQAKAS